MNLYGFLLISFFIFITGIVLIFTRRRPIIILIGIELVFNASALNFAVLNEINLKNTDGQFFALIIICVAVIETMLALSMLINKHKQGQEKE
ncbi:MAG: NADH-quinone oxidoreductase subunit K [Chitinophagaceae bacterium]|nr:NADH-quinone oxidoreductase subunit K [Chitinophagaceae bacterium]